MGPYLWGLNGDLMGTFVIEILTSKLFILSSDIFRPSLLFYFIFELKSELLTTTRVRMRPDPLQKSVVLRVNHI